MSQFRLVLDVRTWHWGSEGLELKEKYYILQELLPGNIWKTLPVIIWKDLSAAEQKEVTDALSS